MTPDQLKLIEESLPRVEMIAKRAARKTPWLFEELISAVRMALFVAAKEFDAAKGVPWAKLINCRACWAIAEARRSELPIGFRGWNSRKRNGEPPKTVGYPEEWTS